MKSLNYKIFFIKEFFGSRIYNSKYQEEHFFNKEGTMALQKILFGNHHKFSSSQSLNKFRDILKKRDLLNYKVTILKHPKTIGLSAPLKIYLNITKKCNLRCRHCLSDAGKISSDELTTADLFSLIKQMRRAGCFFITIGGGEPLLRKDLFEVIKFARENFIAVSIVTNGLLINKKITQKLNSLNLDTITISIDGLEKSHDKIRGNGNFQRTINKIKVLRKSCTTAKLAIRFTINNLNINEYKEIIKISESLSVDILRLTPMLLLGRAKENRELLINQEGYIKLLANLQGIKSKVKLIFPNQGDNKKLWITPDDFGCHCGKEACWITQTGDLYPCIFFGQNLLAGNIRNNNFLNLWEKSKNMVKLCGNFICKDCHEYKKCRGGCRARALWESGNINAIDPLCPLRKNKIY